MLERSPLTWAEQNTMLPGFTVAVDSLETADRLVAELSAHGARLLKTFSKFDREVYAHLVRSATQRGLPVVHDPGPPLFHHVPVDVAIACGARSIEHGKAPWPAVLRADLAQEHDSLMQVAAPGPDRMALIVKVAGEGIDAIDAAKLAALYDDMIARGVCFCPTLEVLAAMAREDAEAGAEAEERSPAMETILTGMARISRHFVTEAARRGVRILVGQDGFTPDATFAEMRNLAACGLSHAEILKGATIYPAEFLGVADEYGALERGRIANILILEQDPLARIEAVAHPFLVVHNGRVVFSRDEAEPR
jgi:hypothetical protein